MSFEDFIIEILKESAWGDELMGLALSLVIKRPVRFISLNSKNVFSVTNISYYSYEKDPVYIFYNKNHFTALALLKNDYEFFNVTERFSTDKY